VATEIEDPFGEDENDLPMDPMGDALKGDCEMNLEVAGVPVNNMNAYCEEIGQSKQIWNKLEYDKMESETKDSMLDQTRKAEEAAAAADAAFRVAAGAGAGRLSTRSHTPPRLVDRAATPPRQP
jgi:hypothetical protein